MSTWREEHIFGRLLIPLQYAFAENPIKLFFVETCLWSLVDATQDKNGKNNTPEARGSVLHPLARMGWVCLIWTYPEARMEKEEDGSWFSLENAFYCRPTEMLLSLWRLVSPLLQCPLNTEYLVLLNVHPTAVCEVGKVTAPFILLIQREADPRLWMIQEVREFASHLPR